MVEHYTIRSERVDDEFFEQDIISVDGLSIYLSDCDLVVSACQIGGYLPVHGVIGGRQTCRLFAVTYERQEDLSGSDPDPGWELLFEWYHSAFEIRRLYDTKLVLPAIEDYDGQAT